MAGFFIYGYHPAMRILNVMLGGKKGGIEQAAVDYAEALISRGHQVTSVIRKGAAMTPAFTAKNFSIAEIAHPHVWNVFARRKIHRLMAQADIVILHGNRAGDLTAGLRRSPPVVSVIHSRFFNRLPHFTAMIATSQAMKDKHEAAAGCPIYFIPNMIRLPAERARPAFRTPPVIGVLGRLSPEKGVDLFIDALLQLRARGIFVKAVIGGLGPEEEKLRVRAAPLGDAVHFAGWVGDKAAFFDGIDIFCLPSRTETFPITVLEAASYGCPSVATKCGGPSEMILDGETGLLAEIEVSSIASALQKMIEAPETAEVMGKAAYGQAAQSYDLPVIAEKLEQALFDIHKNKQAVFP